jgi:hypothetical protein
MVDALWPALSNHPQPAKARPRNAASKPPEHRFFTATDAHGRGIARMVPVRGNGQPAWGEYVRDPIAGGLHLVDIVVIGIAGDRICEITGFETAIAPYFDRPRTLN